jgi:hypothetical protein
MIVSGKEEKNEEEIEALFRIIEVDMYFSK